MTALEDLEEIQSHLSPLTLITDMGDARRIVTHYLPMASPDRIELVARGLWRRWKNPPESPFLPPETKIPPLNDSFTRVETFNPIYIKSIKLDSERKKP